MIPIRISFIIRLIPAISFMPARFFCPVSFKQRKEYLMLIILFLNLSLTVEGQKSDGGDRFDTLYHKGLSLVQEDVKEAEHVLQLLKESNIELHPVEKAKINFLRLQIWKKNSPTKPGQDTGFISVPDSLGTPDALVYRARKYLQRSNPDKAIPLLMEAMKTSTSGSDREILCRICLCEAYREKQEYAKGINMIMEILSGKKHVSDENLAYAYNRLAALYNESNDGKAGITDSVIKYSERCIILASRINSVTNLALAQNELSCQMVRRKQYDRAMSLSLEAARNFRATGDVFNAMNVMINLSDIYLAGSQYDEALKVVDEASGLCDITDNPNIFMRLYLRMSGIYEKKMLYQEAYELLNIVRILQFDFFRDRIDKQINEQSAKYDLFTKEQKIREEQQSNTFHQKQTTFLFIILVVIILVFITTILLLRFRRKEYLKQRLMEAVIETEALERKRIARDLHDGLGPLLSAVNHYFQAYIDGNDIEKEEIRDKTQQVIAGAIDEVSRISHNISPHILENHGLYMSLKDFISHLIAGGKIKVNMKSDINKRFDLKQELSLYRCLTELMTNTVKHANASEIVLNIKDMEKFLVINYSDNGMGFDQNQVKTEGMGLNNIRNRVETFGGKIFFESTPGNGVRVKIEMPVRYE